MLLSAGAILIAGRASAPETSVQARGALSGRPAARVLVAAGPFEAGLDEATRSMLIATCMRRSDDPDRDCDQDELLRGEFPARRPHLDRFSIDANEVTRSEYDACVRAGKCRPIEESACQVYTDQGLQIAMRVPKAMRAPELPAVCLPRRDAATFCAWRSGRLPTHDEWEKAARGAADKRLFPWGDSWEPRAANWGERDALGAAILGAVDGASWTAPPGSYPDSDSAWGARDMAGNVAEWVAPTPYQTEAETRGGSWTSDPFSLRVTGRRPALAGARRTDVGFRCAYDDV